MFLNTELFKHILKENHMTIKSFSEEIGMSRDSINNWLHRGVKVPEWKAEMIMEFLEERFGTIEGGLFY